MSADEVFDFDPGEAPPQAALKLAIAEFGPTTARFLEQLAERFDVDEILYEMILSSIAQALVEHTDIDFRDDVRLT